SPRSALVGAASAVAGVCSDALALRRRGGARRSLARRRDGRHSTSSPDAPPRRPASTTRLGTAHAPRDTLRCPAPEGAREPDFHAGYDLSAETKTAPCAATVFGSARAGVLMYDPARTEDRQ